MDNQLQAGPKAWYSSRTFFFAVSVAVLLAVVIYAFSSRTSDKPPGAATLKGPVAASTTMPLLLTKDPDFIHLIHPAQSDDDLLAHSAEFLKKMQDIESQLVTIQDLDLRRQASDQEWAKVDKKAYIERERKSLADAFPTAMQNIFSKHRADWFEAGHVSFPGTSNFVVSSVDASPLTISDDASVPINISKLDDVYSKFASITGPQIEQAVAFQVQAKSCDQQLKNVCQNLGGTSSECSNPSDLENIRSQIQFSCDVGPSAEDLKKKAQQEARTARIILVGQGDLPSHRVDKLMLVDYDTETVLLELPVDSLTGKMHWKPLIQSQWTAASPARYDSNENAQDTVTTKQVEVVGQIFDVQTEDGKPCVVNELCWWNVIVEEGGNQEWGLSTTRKPPLEKGQYIRAIAEATSREEKLMTKAEIEAHLPKLISYTVVSPETDSDAAAAAQRIKADHDAFADMKSK